MVIIHTGEAIPPPEGITYINRPNIGFDIACLQDVCRERLPGLPNNWERLLWCTDDIFPMRTDFLTPFWSKLTGDVGCAAMEISKEKRMHIRTTGFAITKAVANQLTFPADPVTTKQQCYSFEHLSPGQNMLDQINTMGLKTVWATPREVSPLFDTGYTRRLKHRWADHVKLFGEVEGAPAVANRFNQRTQPPVPPGDGKVTIIAPMYGANTQIVSALQNQTFTNWELWLIHDGPMLDNVQLVDDVRIRYKETPVHQGKWGHYIRRDYLQQVTTEYVLITNPDNYYMPKFLEKAVNTLSQYQKSVAAYCAQIVHNYTDYKVMNCSLRRGFIDCGQVLLRTKEAQAVGWNSLEHSSDWFFFNDIATKYGRDKFITFNGCHFVHN